MTTTKRHDDPQRPAAPQAGPGLSQRGRAGMELLGSLQRFSSAYLRPRAEADFAADPAAMAMIAEHAADTAGTGARRRIAKARAIADTKPLFRLERFVQRWVAEENFNFGIPAVEERRAQFDHLASSVPDTGALGTLELSAIAPPKYYDTEWHLEPGGWDGYDLYGPLFAWGIGPLVFARGGFAAVGVDADQLRQRADTVAQFPKASYARIFEPGCGSGPTFGALGARFPDAELVGCDLSANLLRNAHRLAEKIGIKAHFKQRDLLDTGEPSDSVDAVITYALHHELPPKVNAQLFEEMFRIMKPGADFIASDPPPFRRVDLFHAVILDWDTQNRNEPFFSAVLHTDLEQQMRDAGFVDVKSHALEAGGYPWVMSASKPVATSLADAA